MKVSEIFPWEEPPTFEECLDQSHRASDLPIWDEIYRKAFPEMKAMIDERQDGYHQKAGVDRRLILPGTRQVLIDEKVRGKNRRTGKVYDDIALEFVSNTRTGTPGWVCKQLLAEYIAYTIAPLGKCYLLPVLPLQAAWRRHEKEWKKRFGVLEAQNNGYKTLFVPITDTVLFPAMGGWHRIDCTPITDIFGNLE